MAKRFDRYIASPEAVALPQNYDEFLLNEELPCLVEGCSWQGRGLGLHVNLAHGITAADFKRICGFNKGTGLIPPDMAKLLSERALTGVALLNNYTPNPHAHPKGYSLSLEGKEHYNKTQALIRATEKGPMRICCGCGTEFQQSTPFGHAKFCTKTCRRSAYFRRYKERKISHEPAMQPVRPQDAQGLCGPAPLPRD
jgi:hypothetical protein